MTIKDLPKIKITKSEEIWLTECWNHLKNHNYLDSYKHIKVKTLNRIPKDFKPWKIDDKLIRENVEITLKGLIALNLEKEAFDIGNKTFLYIKNELFEDVDKKGFDLNFIADCINEERRLTKIVYKLFSNEGLNLWNGAGSKSDSYGYDSITIGNSSFDTYMNFDSIDEVFLYKQKSIKEYQETQKKLETKPYFDLNSYDEAYKNKSLFPLELLSNTRGYIINIGNQASLCYQSGLYDASLVMIRKLLETLIIECFEFNSISNKIKNKDNYFFYLGDLIDLFVKEPKWSLSRNTINSLPKIKKLGDLSAHNRRFSAKKHDLDKISEDLRIVIEELIHLIDYSGLNKSD
ncbi:hypothetical protein [Gaetbulibacter jejuensis]|uniref:DUF4145 domain-containing protein n=1 Tax=Gaetbulibacter jejuensis TaxID=584607 RepID=A0ABN1JMY7_9FLAO